MRPVYLLALSLMISSAAHAGIKQACSGKQSNSETYATCIDIERKRAANTLRDLDPKIMQVMHADSKKSGNTNRLDAYRKSQVEHVRKRQNNCRQQDPIARNICEGDMDNVQIRSLQKYLEEK